MAVPNSNESQLQAENHGLRLQLENVIGAARNVQDVLRRLWSQHESEQLQIQQLEKELSLEKELRAKGSRAREAWADERGVPDGVRSASAPERKAATHAPEVGNAAQEPPCVQSIRKRADDAMGAAATTRRSNIPMDDYLRANRAALEATCGTAVHAVIAERAVDPLQALAMHVWQLANDARRERRASAVAAPADEDEELEPLDQMDGKWHFCQWMRGSTAVAGIVASAVRQTSPHPLPDAKAELAYVKSRFGGSKEDFAMRLLSGPLMRRIIDELWDAAGKLQQAAPAAAVEAAANARPRRPRARRAQPTRRR